MLLYLARIHYAVWLCASVTCFGLGELLSKRFILDNTLRSFLIMQVFYTLGGLLWLPALASRRDLGTTGAMWSMMSLVITALIGVFYYQEQLLPRNIAGIVLALVAIALCH